MRSRKLKWIAPLASFGLLLVAVAIYGFRSKPVEVIVPELTAPIKISFGACFADGGSTAVILVGANSEHLLLALPADARNEPNRNFDERGMYLGWLDDVKDGKGTKCPIPSDAATKIASYLEQAIHEAYPTADIRHSAALPAGLSFDETQRLRSVKFILSRIRIEQAQGYRKANNMSDVDSEPGWLKNF